jgi:hypothetical protein
MARRRGAPGSQQKIGRTFHCRDAAVALANAYRARHLEFEVYVREVRRRRRQATSLDLFDTEERAGEAGPERKL